MLNSKKKTFIREIGRYIWSQVLLLFAYSAFALGCLFCGLARSMNELIAARVFAGIGGGGMTT